jgi:hypothetical protein
MARGVLPALWALPRSEDMARSGKFGFNELQREGYPNELRTTIIRSSKPTLMTRNAPWISAYSRLGAKKVSAAQV